MREDSDSPESVSCPPRQDYKLLRGEIKGRTRDKVELPHSNQISRVPCLKALPQTIFLFALLILVYPKTLQDYQILAREISLGISIEVMLTKLPIITEEAKNFIGTQKG
jgi:hypothetical protein